MVRRGYAGQHLTRKGKVRGKRPAGGRRQQVGGEGREERGGKLGVRW